MFGIMVSTLLFFKLGSSERLSSLCEGDALFFEIGDMGAMVAIRRIGVRGCICSNIAQSKKATLFPYSTAPSRKVVELRFTASCRTSLFELHSVLMLSGQSVSRKVVSALSRGS